MTLHDLTFLNKGKPWPPESEKTRIKEYEDNEALREGEVNEVWPDLYKYLRDGTSYKQDFYINFPWLVTKKAIDTILGEPPAITSDPENTNLTDFILQSNYRQVLREQVADLDAFGDCIQKIYRDENGEVQIESIEPEHWYPVLKKGTRQVDYHVLAFEFSEGDKAYLEAEIHSKKEIEHRVYSLNKTVANGINSTIGDLQDLSQFHEGLKDIETNPLGDFLVVTAHNQRMSGELYGCSSYGPDFKSILKRIIIRYSLANNNLDVFSRPTLVGPRNMETYDPVTGKNVFRPGEYKGVDFDPGQTPFVPQAVVWDSHIMEGDALTKALEEKLYIVAELPKAAVSMESAGVAASGVAWKLAMSPLLSKCSRIRDEIDVASKQALNLAMRLSGRDVPISISWQDGLPQIPIEQAQEFSTLSMTPAFQGEEGITWLLTNKLGIPEDKAKAIAEDPSRGGGLGGMV